jgi:CheY-like chemotaxis protein
MDFRNTQKTRVLIVDDNRDAADSLACLLEIGQREVRVAYDGESGLRMAREFVPHCLISDVRMPGMDGYDLARQIRSDPKLAEVKLIALSGFRDSTHNRLSSQAGFDFQVTKGTHLRELMEIIVMIDEIKELATRTQQLAQQNVELAGQTRELLMEVHEEVQEVRQDIKELKQEMKELKKDQGNKADE